MNVGPTAAPALAAEARRLEEGALHYEHSHRLAAGRWRALGAIVGGTAAVLSGLAAALTGAEVGSTWIAVLVGALGGSSAAALTFFKPAERASQHEQAHIGFNLLRGDLRRFAAIDILLLNDGDLSSRMESLIERRDSLVSSSPHYSQRLFNRARSDIQSGLFHYAEDARTLAALAETRVDEQPRT